MILLLPVFVPYSCYKGMGRMTINVAVEDARWKLLESAAEEIRQKGYRAASLSKIINRARLSKGALYHHFQNKKQLGFAVLEEVFYRDFLDFWAMPISGDEPYNALNSWFQRLSNSLTTNKLAKGCCVCNISMEMSSLDEDFRERVTYAYGALCLELVTVLERAQQENKLKKGVVPQSLAMFVISSLRGLILLGRHEMTVRDIRIALQSLREFLQAQFVHL